MTSPQSSQDYELLVGGNVFIRTVTMFFIGELVRVSPRCLVIKNASWIGDTGYFKKFLTTGNPSESEPYPPNDEVMVSLAAIIDVCPFNHPLPTRVIGRNE